jgi:uncharacterized protein (TIGR02285 family)
MPLVVCLPEGQLMGVKCCQAQKENPVMPPCSKPTVPESSIRLTLALLAIIAFPAAAESIELALWPIPGIVNLVDGKPSDGLTMDGLALLWARLPELTPTYRLANRPRQQRMMAQGVDFCATPLFRRDDSDENGYFIPWMASTPIQAVIRQRDLERFPLENGYLSLSRVLSETDLRAGVSGFRTYTPHIQSWTEQAAAQGRLERVTGSQSGENLVQMVSYGRFDLTFELSSISQTLARAQPLPEPLLSLPLDEDRALFETGIYCTRSPWGYAMAGRLDQAVREVAADPDALLELYAAAMPSETWTVFAPAMREYYRVRATTTTHFEPAATKAEREQTTH